jgi:hypothetical protein
MYLQANLNSHVQAIVKAVDTDDEDTDKSN